jgi:hypothetical protein
MVIRLAVTVAPTTSAGDHLTATFPGQLRFSGGTECCGQENDTGRVGCV